MPLRTRVWSAGKVFVLAGAIVATYLLFAVASMRMALWAREVSVPALIGQTELEATGTATLVGLTLVVDDVRRPDAAVEAGRILVQDPAPGAPLRRGRSVHVWLSRGPRAAIVPALAGEPERNARVRLTEDGFDLASLSEIRTSAYPSDVVVAQDPPPPAGAERVALLVNRGEYGLSYVMPDLIGLDGDRATDVLRRHGFRVSVVGSSAYPGLAAGIVLRQNPQAGFQIPAGEPVSIEVSR
jgi:beta-lactam-binding protein with PASTA domain